MTFVVSLRLGEPPVDRAAARAASSATRRCASSSTRPRSWTDELIAALVETGAVDSVDFKGLYKGTVVDQPPDPELYRARRRGLPRRVDRGSRRDHAGDRRGARAAYRDRITWDAPIHSIARHRGAAVRAADGQHQAVADRRPAQALRAPTTTAPSAASAPTAAASSSSARAAARSSTSPRCSTPTRPTTSRRAALTTTTRRPGCPPARWRPRRATVGFRWDSA